MSSPAPGNDPYQIPRSLTSILSRPIAHPDWTVEPIMESGDRLLVYGEWGAFKSLWATHLALALASGRSVGPFTIPRARRVLYLDEEMNPRRTDRRIQRLTAGMRLPLDSGLPFHVLNRTGLRFNQEGVGTILRYTKALHFEPGDIVVYDSLRRGIVGSENDPKDVSEFYRQADALANEGLGLGITHHMTKPRRKNRDTRHAASGSTDIMAGVDQALSIVRDALRIEIVHEKGREGEADPFTVVFTFAEDPKTGPIAISYERVVVPGKAPSNADNVLAHLGTAGGQAQRKDIIEATKLHANSVDGALETLERKGLVENQGHGLWRLSEQGQLQGGLLLGDSHAA